MIRFVTDRFNIIIDFLIEIENHDIIVLLKSDPDDELVEDDTI